MTIARWLSTCDGRQMIEQMIDHDGPVPDTPIAAAHRLLVQAVEQLCTVAGSAGDAELLSVLTVCEGAARRLDRVSVDAVSVLQRRGTFAERGYRSATAAVRDLLGCDSHEARRRVAAAEQVCPRAGLDGTALPARLPATAEVFSAGHTSLRHVEVVSKVLGSAAAERLSPQVWAGAEAELAARAAEYTPAELLSWGAALVDGLDQDGPEPDDRPPPGVNELHLTRRAEGGGALKGRIDDAAMFDAIATLIDAKARPTAPRTTEGSADARPKRSPTPAATSSTMPTSPNAAAADHTSTCTSAWRTWKAAAAPLSSTSAAG